ncbi:MAG: YqaJ viral recombinase family protein [Desulfovibrionaceae bacterium]|nr:YqaJ viral recombinase family protein [Desulfovibrionaceae bacterium]
MQKLKLDSEAQWLEARKGRITGTFASYLMGEGYENKSPSQLVEIFKNGNKKNFTPEQQEKIDFGKYAEKHLRALFALEYGVKVIEEENTLYISNLDERIVGSVDGLIESRLGLGVLEIKTSSCNCSSPFMRNNALRKWDSIPRYYYWQVIHYMLVTDAQYACVRAYNRISCVESNCEQVNTCRYRNYKKFIDFQMFRRDVEGDIQALKERCLDFLEAVDNGKLPSFGFKL